MKISVFDDCLPIFKALACETRLDILRLLTAKPMNQQELARALGISPAIISGHVRQLCEAGLIYTVSGEAGYGKQKRCYIADSEILLNIAKRSEENAVTYSMPVGLYTRHKVAPSCGLASDEGVIGDFDDESAFWDPKRTQAGLVWLTTGYLEYNVPISQNGSKIRKLTCSLEVASEYPGYKFDWPTEITFSINGVELGSWICPGNFGGRRGRHTPNWWPLVASQFGLLKTITVDESGSFIDDEKMSDITIEDLKLSDPKFSIRFAVKDDADPSGGLTIFGKCFGDYQQDIVITAYYE